jgi:hypothetical protein
MTRHFWAARGRRILVVVIACALIAGCDTSSVTSAPSAVDGPAATPAPGSTLGPPAKRGTDGSQIPGGGPIAAVDPLPIPSIADAFEVGQSLYDPTNTATAVMSLLGLMGVEVRGPGGSVLLAGADNGAGQLRLTDGEAHGLIEMTQEDLAEHADLTGLPTVADLYAALAPSLPAGYSVAEFADAYNRAYQEHPDALAGQAMLGQPITPDTPLLRVQAWLLLVDGVAGTSATASLASLVTGAARPRLGSARANLPTPQSQVPGLSNAEWAELLVALPTLAFRVTFRTEASGIPHEGHGGLGARVDVTATVDTPEPLVSSDGHTILLQTGVAAGLAVTWDSRDVGTLSNHGTLNGNLRTPVALDASGSTQIGYTPKKELANGDGAQVEESGDLGAYVEQYTLVAKTFSLGGADATARRLIHGRRRAVGAGFPIRWHEREYIAVGILNVYEFAIGAPMHLMSIYRKGKDLTLGVLYRASDGVYRGTMTAVTDSVAVGDAFLGLAGTASCHDTLRSSQELAVDATVSGGKVLLHFYPASAPAILSMTADDDLAALVPGPFPPCQQTIPFTGSARHPAGSYAPINDTRWSTSAGYAFSLPDVGQRLTITDNAQVGAAASVCSVFYIVAYRPDPNVRPAQSPAPLDPVPVPGVCDQTSPP